MNILVMAQSLESWQLFFYSMLCGWQMSYSPKIWVFWVNLDELRHPQSWRGQVRPLWNLQPLYSLILSLQLLQILMVFVNLFLVLFFTKNNIIVPLTWSKQYENNFSLSKSIRSRYAQPSPCPKGENHTQIGHHMWKMSASKFGS